eukprot:TRINITY_DN18765_c0_g1_i2.p1 TRINITY_DN18765_c0_g1~~TRINITY_DN18765_c0_g1_i2.p1  ORF type:complete len:176 (-),score=37.81 TRINITY_DN18765_c0_g1_i2:222-749(-)
MDDHPLSFVEKPLTRCNTKLDAIDRKTLTKYILKLSKAVERKLSQRLKKSFKFALMMDGWTDDTSTHYVAVYAVMRPLQSRDQDDGRAYYDRVLLSFSPLANEANYTAQNHYEYVSFVLSLYDVGWQQVVCIVADNVSLNGSISDLAGVPMVGCMSHRLSLAVTKTRSDECKMFA